ncbi:MAG TPA: pyridoxal 5'-phosphate synthase glutaminase subunit PdxT [Acidimicrobiales bacterium]|jgi:5'-phosphate synthase pdxT subunit
MTAHPIGILDLQGDVREHVAVLRQLGVATQLVKRPADLSGVGGLILPGGESTTLSMLLTSTGLFDAVAARLEVGLPVLGTCAGLVLLAADVLDGRPDQRSFGALDVAVRRNGFGRQAQSFETDVLFGEGTSMPAVFIRAPRVVRVGAGVEVLGRLEQDDLPVIVRHDHVLASCFHPELTADHRVHELFVSMCEAAEA